MLAVLRNRSAVLYSSSARRNKRVQHLVLFTKSSVYTLKLSQKSDFQSLTTKPDRKDHPTVENRQI
jgi:hypothetical protein